MPTPTLTGPHPRMPTAIAAELFHPDVIARLRVANADVLDDAVEAWHEAGGAGVDLAAWLGMGDEEHQLWVLDSAQAPGAYPIEELPQRLAIARTAFSDMAARMVLWSNPNRKAIMAVLSSTSSTDEARAAALRHLTASAKEAQLLLRLCSAVA